MPWNGSTNLRTTQRAPRSCVSCSARKVKCDKAIPCSTCIRRGTAENCVREVVLVRGEARIAQDPPDIPPYGELLKENGRLREELEVERQSAKPRLPARQFPPVQDDDVLERIWLAHCSYATNPHVPMEVKIDWHSIVVPSPICSKQLVEYDKKWNSWAHYALEYPLFDEEHDNLFHSLKKGAALEQIGSSWLAVYFSVLCAALLMMNDGEAKRLLLPQGFTHDGLCRHWYEAALFCLHEAEFMRKADIRNVQAVAILGMCFHNFGDPDLSNNMWSCAIRTAQKLGIDNPGPKSRLPLCQEAQRRLWWTLVICEWMAVPYHPPQIEEGDFPLVLPTPETSPETSPATQESGIDSHDSVQPVHYHIFMARTAIVHHRFRVLLRSGTLPVADVVRRADRELADIITTLPDYLQPDSEATDMIRQLETVHPWVKWQRFDITLVLLHHRLRINRVLQRQWLLAHETAFKWAQSVCIKSATAIIWISRHWDQPVSMRKQWALSLHLYVAGIMLFRESRNPHGERKFHDEIQTAITQLDGVAPQNVVASHAADLLRRLLQGEIFE